MKRFILIFFLISIAAFSEGKDKLFPVAEIPAELKKNSDAVVRLHEVSYEILDKDNAVYRVRYAVTIFSEEADGLAMVYEDYDKLSRIKEFSAWVYDASGNEIMKLKKGDIIDRSYVSGFSLYEDDRLKMADLSQTKYPYTVYSEIEKSYKYVYQLPPFAPVTSRNLSVQQAKYQLRAPADLFPRYKQINVDTDPHETVVDGVKELTWELRNLTAVNTVSFGYSWFEKAPLILSAPSKFSYEGYDGDMTTWDSFGTWIRSLNADRNTLPEATKEKLREMTSGMNDREKVMTIYDYMQERTRYVSIQLGIGGYQPFRSGLVDEVGYGDCKALSFYTKSMLEAVGVNSNYTLIFAGSQPIPLFEDFPSATFNHAILAVPMENDTIWLECTSQTKPNGFLGSSTHDRKALMITEDGAEVVKTPVYDQSDNYERRVAKVIIDDEGSAKATVQTRYGGIMYEFGGLSQVLHLGHEEQKEWVHKVTRIPHYELQEFAMVNHEAEVPFAEVNLELMLPQFTSMVGKRIFFMPNLMNSFSNPLPKEDIRSEPVRIKPGFSDMDSIVFEFPSNLRPEYLPEPVEVTNEFGTYRSSYEFIQGRLIYKRDFMLKKGEYTPEQYDALFEFFNTVAREDRRKVVMLGGT